VKNFFHLIFYECLTSKEKAANIFGGDCGSTLAKDIFYNRDWVLLDFRPKSP
jgi:hypothetical protein